MKTFKKIIREIRASNNAAYKQMELPLRGVRLGKEESRVLLDLRRLREQLAQV